MNKIFTGLMAAVLSLGIMGSSIQTADAGKRERRIAAGIGLGILGAAIIGREVHRDRRYRKHRRHYRSYHAPRRHYNRKRYRNRHYYNDYAPRRVHKRKHRRNQLSAAHKGWCSGHYRSYRAWDNTFQPYHGPRRACYSPYN